MGDIGEEVSVRARFLLEELAEQELGGLGRRRVGVGTHLRSGLSCWIEESEKGSGFWRESVRRERDAQESRL